MKLGNTPAVQKIFPSNSFVLSITGFAFDSIEWYMKLSYLFSHSDIASILKYTSKALSEKFLHPGEDGLISLKWSWCKYKMQKFPCWGLIVLWLQKWQKFSKFFMHHSHILAVRKEIYKNTRLLKILTYSSISSRYVKKYDWKLDLVTR